MESQPQGIDEEALFEQLKDLSDLSDSKHHLRPGLYQRGMEALGVKRQREVDLWIASYQKRHEQPQASLGNVTEDLPATNPPSEDYDRGPRFIGYIKGQLRYKPSEEPATPASLEDLRRAIRNPNTSEQDKQNLAKILLGWPAKRRA